MRTILVYDGSFDDFLSAVFWVYEEKMISVAIQSKHQAIETFFDTLEIVSTCEKKASRVWKGLSKTCSKTGKNNIYRAFLTEKEGVENLLLYFIQKSFEMGMPLENDFSDPKILKISKLVKMVHREKHRMDAFVRFRETKDGLYFATVAPDFNVLSLLINHFKDRYANQKWIIYDTKRTYGIYYDLHSVTYITLENTGNVSKKSNESHYFTAAELAFEDLWKNYFNSTNIPSRKNTKLHLQHVPKRYWKYLSEKSPH